MKRISSIDFSGAEKAFGIAQAPLFLMRKLLSDPVIKEVAEQFSGKAILSELRKILVRKPRTLRSVAKPYALLVALSFNSDISYLRKAAKLRAPYSFWYVQIANTLLELYKPLSEPSVQINNSVGPYKISNISTTATNIKVSGGQ